MSPLRRIFSYDIVSRACQATIERLRSVGRPEEGRARQRHVKKRKDDGNDVTKARYDNRLLM